MLRYGRSLVLATSLTGAAAALTALWAYGAAVTAADAADAIPAYVTSAVTVPGRSQQDMETDRDRKTVEIIAFSRMKPGDKVVDFIPGEGFYTRIFSKLVGAKGRVYPLVTLSGTRNARLRREADAKAGLHNAVDDVLPIQDVHEFKQNVSVIWQNVGQYGGQFETPEQADVVWNYGAYHALHTKAQGSPDMVSVNKAIFLAMKPGATYLVADYASAPGKGFADAEALKRSDPEAVKAEITSAGFVFDGESNVLRNPADDHSKPSSDTSLKNKADLYILRFKKPANAINDKRQKPDPRIAWYGNTNFADTEGGKYRISIFLQPDGSYQEYQNRSDRLYAAGYHYLAADGKVCILHEWPAYQRGYVFCAFDLAEAPKEGVNMLKGYVYPPEQIYEPEYP